MADTATPPAATAGASVSVVLRLGTAQTLAWASSYYLPTLLAAPMARDLGLRSASVFLAFSGALLIAALLGPWAGRTIDRQGGRTVLGSTSLLFAAGLAAMACAQGPVGLAAAWGLMGLAMGAGLYEAAFAALVAQHGHAARRAISGITLLAGFASTVGWPLSAWMEAAWGWRGSCLGWAALHLLIGLPLNLSLPFRTPANPRANSGPAPQEDASRPAEAAPQGTAPHAPRTAAADTPTPEAAHAPAHRNAPGAMALLGLVFAIGWFTSTAMAAHLPALLQAHGATAAGALALATLVGPAQVVARILEFGGMQRLHPLTATRLATLGHPLGALILMALGSPAAIAFVLLHGAGNGILTIAKGTLPLALFGPTAYGARQGWILLPGRLAQVLAPGLFGLWMEHDATRALWWTAAGGVIALLALQVLGRISLPAHTSQK
ncbi:MAG: MFS transporter [Burkholderiaceae bacterium]|nr:MFS transporter [Burkholderiaceae bacterium]